MNQEPSSEDLSILAVIANLEREADPSMAGGPPGDETAETLARLYTEVLGLIPLGLDPVAPSAGARERLLAAVGAGPAVGAAPPAPRPAAPPAPPAPTPPTPPTAITEAYRPGPRMAPGPVPRRHSRWPLTIAAILALTFAGTSVWLWFLQQGQSAEIAGLQREVQTQRQLAARSARNAEEGRQARTEMEKMRDRFALVTSPAVEVLPLQPAAGSEGNPTNARGMLFVAPDHQHWYLSLEGLPPAPEGGVYKLWWMTKQGPRDAGSLVAASGEKIQMGSDEMPAGIIEVRVTLEPGPGSDQPTGPTILQART